MTHTYRPSVQWAIPVKGYVSYLTSFPDFDDILVSPCIIIPHLFKCLRQLKAWYGSWRDRQPCPQQWWGFDSCRSLHGMPKQSKHWIPVDKAIWIGLTNAMTQLSSENSHKNGHSEINLVLTVGMVQSLQRLAVFSVKYNGHCYFKQGLLWWRPP